MDTPDQYVIYYTEDDDVLNEHIFRADLRTVIMNRVRDGYELKQIRVALEQDLVLPEDIPMTLNDKEL